MNAKTLVIFSFNAKSEQPLRRLIFDSPPAFAIGLFDYSASYPGALDSVLFRVGDQCMNVARISASTECKGDILLHCHDFLGSVVEGYDYIAFFDDDILIRVSSINEAIRQGAGYRLTTFQPALAPCSFYSHSFTLQKKS